MTRVTSQTGEALLKALGSIYVACCLSCRHIAVRYNETARQYECDWCRIVTHESRQREFLRRLGWRDNGR